MDAGFLWLVGFKSGKSVPLVSFFDGFMVSTNSLNEFYITFILPAINSKNLRLVMLRTNMTTKGRIARKMYTVLEVGKYTHKRMKIM